MRKTMLTCTLLMMLSAISPGQTAPAPAGAGEAASQPAAATAQSTAQTAPADAPRAQQASAETVAILDRLERAGAVHTTIRADVSLTLENATLGDRQARTGWLAYRGETADQPARIRIHFDTLSLDGGPRVRERIDYAFDGQWATVARHNTRTMELYQVAPPGEQAPALKLGQGPLPPLPFGQKTQDVLEHFEPSTRPLAAGEPAGTTYLKLVTREAYRQELSFTWLEMWIGRDDLPVRIVAMERNGNLQTILLSDVKTNEPTPDDTFRLPTSGWKVERHPYESK